MRIIPELKVVIIKHYLNIACGMAHFNIVNLKETPKNHIE